MNPEMFVPIIIIANFKMLRNLSQDVALITSVLRESRVLIVNEEGTMVKPNVNAQRSTLIVNVPTSTPVEDVKALFVGTDLPEVVEIESDGGDCWSVTFENEEAAMKALQSLQEKTFNGHPIHPQIKVDALYYSYAPVPMDPNFYQGMGFFYPPMGNPENPDAYGTQYGYGNYEQYRDRRGNRRGGNRSEGGQRYERRQPADGQNANSDPNARSTDRTTGARQSYGNRGRGNGGREGQPRENREQVNNAKPDVRNQDTANRRRRGSTGKQAAYVPGDFPPLPGAQTSGSPSAYTGEYKSYTKGEFAEIIKNTAVEKPAELDEAAAPVVRDAPVTGLETMAPVETAAPKKMTAADLAKKAPAQNAKNAKASPKTTSPSPTPTPTPKE
eukprot:TRINITY_DN4219_c0_g1_i2.p1 TRINITY_DN4219_c0_g1~~TRINITY_DN4219_c0_g1_i2.p1  ORF type:complete len:386 (-),score=132.50 TRINITY_DN4219_c0_g1_i2:189-1346(-)